MYLNSCVCVSSYFSSGVDKTNQSGLSVEVVTSCHQETYTQYLENNQF